MAVKRRSALQAPFLKRISLVEERVDADAFPFNRLAFLRQPDFSLTFPRPITFFVGENGSGKSTLMEGLALLCDFPEGGGAQDHLRPTQGRDQGGALAAALRPEWLPRVRSGFFLRAESFYNLVDYLDEVGAPDRYGGRDLQAQSHGESVLGLLSERLRDMGRAIILLDEPEAALSPSRQLALLALLREWELAKTVQVIIATHSPILLCYPGATLYQFDEDGISETTVEQTDHFRVTRAFLRNPARYLAELFGEPEEGD